LHVPAEQERTARHEQCIRSLATERFDGGVDVAAGAGIDGLESNCFVAA
jgi:hypothetical protein